MTCQTVAELLLDYLEGALPPQQADLLRAHLDQCPVCAARCRETRALLGDLSSARSAEQHAWSSDAGQTPQPQPTPLKERSVIGDFQILGELGRGGMGVVYRARQMSLNRTVALKVLSTGLVQSERSVSRFAREAQAAARLHHTNIVPVYAQGREGDHFYYAMELIEGESLDKILRREREGEQERRRAESGRQPPHKTTRLLSSPTRLLRSAASTVGLSRPPPGLRHSRDYKRIARSLAGVAEGLHHAHQQGVIHRDVKPQNLMLGPDEELHITDFGLARLLDEPGLTLSTEIVGTPAYMAPEQITAGGQAIDPRTDVYALGVTLYEMLTLERPFQADTYDQTIHEILHREPKAPRKLDPRVPPDLETICLRALEKEPPRRFPNAAELARDLRRYAEDYPILSRPIGPLGKTLRWIRRHPWRASAIAASTLLVVVVPLALTFFNATGNADIERAFGILLNDYRERDHALAELGWVSRLGGDDYRREFVTAFACIRTDPERSIEILEGALASHPDDPDAHYLIAWAYARRTQTQGVEMWADAQRHIALADALDAETSAEGWFFRGQAVWGLDPAEAVSSFDKAIAGRANFTQAMLHQGRALNQIMYSLRDISYYQSAVGPLKSAAHLQPNKAYPRYLLSITHMLAAEIYRDADPPQLEKAAEAYDKSLAAAREAQRVERSSPRGYAAEAGYHECRADFAQAIAAWNRYDDPTAPVITSESDRSERFAYQMRLHFWLGDYAAAEQMRAKRYSPLSGYDPDELYDADETLYQALIAASAGDHRTAEQALASGVQRSRGRPECLLRLDAACRLVGRPPPPGLLTDTVSAECKLSPGWTPKWLAILVGYQRGELDWSAVEAAANLDPQRSDDTRLRLAAAHFFRGARELAAGRRQQAIGAFDAARRQYDNENYCFRAKLLLVKLQTAPDWPPWLTSADRAAP